MRFSSFNGSFASRTWSSTNLGSRYRRTAATASGELQESPEEGEAEASLKGPACVPGGGLRYGLIESSVFVRPTSGGESDQSFPILQIDLQTGRVVSVSDVPADLEKEALGIFGMADLGSAGWALCLITEAEWVAMVDDADIYLVTGTEMVVCTSGTPVPRLANLLKDAIDPKVYGQSMYFSPTMDLSLSMQRQASAANNRTSGPQSSQGLKRYLWNGHLAKPFDDAGMGSVVVRLIMGSVQQMAGLEWSDGHQRVLGSITVISRNSVKRAGCRQWRRGANPKGEAANSVETEQVMQFCHDGGFSEDATPRLASFVQVRGSIPLLWSQAPNLAFKPPTHVGPTEAGKMALKAHFSALSNDYGKVHALSLVSDHGAEGRLQMVFDEGMQELQAEAMDAEGPDLIRFDVHAECGALSNTDLPEKLVPKVEGALAKCGFFLRAGSVVERWQEGIIRTNCFDSVDRTNMAQTFIARRALEHVLYYIDLMLQRPGLTLRLAFPNEDAQLRGIWADNGDELGYRYAGSGAMKSSYTRAGYMSMQGLATDAMKGVTRYFRNCFSDGRKQDAINLFLGDFKPVKQQKNLQLLEPSTGNPTSPAPLFTLFTFGCGIAWVIHTVLHQRIAISLFAGVVAMCLLFMRGSSLIDHPTLCKRAHKEW